MSAFDDLQSIPPQRLADGYLARAVHGARLKLAIVEIEPGAELPEHRHANEQLGMVIEGSVVFRVGNETCTVEPDGVWRIPANTPHTVTGGEAGAVVVDIFSPARDDWASRVRYARRTLTSRGTTGECQSDPPSLLRTLRCSRPRGQPPNRSSPLDLLLHVRTRLRMTAAAF